MAQAITPNLSQGRRQAVERRRAHSQQGAGGVGGRSRSAAGNSSAGRAAETERPSASSSSAPVRSGRSPSSGALATGREASIARRRAMADRGKAGIAAPASEERTRAASARTDQNTTVDASEKNTGKGKDCGCGGRKNESGNSRDSQPMFASDAGGSSRLKVRSKTGLPRNIGQPEGRQLSKARRQLLAQRGRKATEQTDRVRQPAQRARQLNPDLSSRELAREVRAERSRNGGRGQKNNGPCGRQRPVAGGAEDATWKVGSSETASGQTVTGTRVGRSQRVTGDEPSTCRVITGTEYMGADIFREFCQTEATPNPRKVAVTSTASGRSVTGTEVGRGKRVTGDEAGTCKRVTGNEYLPAEQVSAFCGTDAPRTPARISITRTGGGRAVSGSNVDRPSRVTGTEAGADRMPTGTPYVSAMRRPEATASVFKKVGETSTFRGARVTGVMVGRSERVTGDEPGTCRQITGDEYLGSEQYKAFCGVDPRPEAGKVGLSETNRGKAVTGTQAGRSPRVTGDEPGTCQMVTGTPYAAIDTYRQYCAPEVAQSALARSRAGRATPGMRLTGLQPGIGGKMTGDRKGACEAITGTPYVGEDQYGANCGLGAVPGNADFPQPLAGAPWTATFSITTPAREAQQAREQAGVTGTRYDQGGNITGPFGMAEGKITGTEQFRFGGQDSPPAEPVPALPEPIPGETNDAPKSRITGEGMDTGLRITGDDWGRNERVTGTEGRSAVRRNPTRRGAAIGAMAMMARQQMQEEKQYEVAPSRVTGSSGNTEKGARITVSGGARG